MISFDSGFYISRSIDLFATQVLLMDENIQNLSWY